MEEVAEGCSSTEGESVLLICLLDPQTWKNTIVRWLLYGVSIPFMFLLTHYTNQQREKMWIEEYKPEDALKTVFAILYKRDQKRV